MGRKEGFKGYGPEQGYDFLLEAIAAHYRSQGAEVAADEVFVSRRLQVRQRQHAGDLRGRQRRRGDRPGLPGLRRHQRDGRPHRRRRRAAAATAAWSTCPPPPRTASIRRCPIARSTSSTCARPTTPPARVIPRASLARWIDYAKQNEAVILFDAAYEAFIREPGQVHSIYELPGAREVAIEFRSLSKTAGFTGTRCAYTVIPKELDRAQRPGRAGAAARAVEPAAHHQVQRHQLPHPEGGRRRLPARGQGGHRGEHRLLHGERAHHPRGAERGRATRCSAA